MEIITWFTANKEDLIAAYTALVTVASIIIKLVPQLDKDNKFKSFVKFVAKYIALNR